MDLACLSSELRRQASIAGIADPPPLPVARPAAITVFGPPLTKPHPRPFLVGSSEILSLKR
jgi:hypothetical protein